MDRLTEVFCRIDDFCQAFEPEWEKHLLADGSKKRQRSTSLCLSEWMTLAVLFHQLRFRQFKSFYLLYVQRYLRAEFPGLPSYQRCLELLPRCVVPLSALFEVVKGECTGITILDFSPIAVCDNLLRDTACLPGSRRAARVRLDGSSVSNCISPSTSAARLTTCWQYCRRRSAPRMMCRQPGLTCPRITLPLKSRRTMRA